MSFFFYRWLKKKNKINEEPSISENDRSTLSYLLVLHSRGICVNPLWVGNWWLCPLEAQTQHWKYPPFFRLFCIFSFTRYIKSFPTPVASGFSKSFCAAKDVFMHSHANIHTRSAMQQKVTRFKFGNAWSMSTKGASGKTLKYVFLFPPTGQTQALAVTTAFHLTGRYLARLSACSDSLLYYSSSHTFVKINCPGHNLQPQHFQLVGQRLTTQPHSLRMAS